MIDLKRTQKDIQKVQNELNNLKGLAQQSAQRALFDASLKFQEISDPSVPVVTGNLKSSSYREKLKNTVKYGKNTDYAHRNERLRGWFTTPLQNNQSQLKEFVEERFKNYFF